MKKKYLVAIPLLLSNFANGQSLFAEDPNEDVTTPLPLRFNASVGIGYDDSFTSSGTTPGTSSTYVNAALGADYVSFTPKTSWKVNAQISANKYLSGTAGGSDIFYNGRLNLNLNHRLNQRTRYVQNTFVNYGIEPNFSFSFSENTAASENLFYSSSHAIGHRWTARLGTFTGVKVSGVFFNNSGDRQNNRRTYSFFNNFRYAAAPNTTLTANFRYDKTESSGSAGDATDIVGSLGLEHQISRNNNISAQIGATRRQVDGGRRNFFSPYVRVSINSRLNNRARLKTFARYGNENFGTSFGSTTFDSNQALRVGTSLSYQVSPKLTLNTGVNYITYDYSDGRDTATGASVGDESQSLINPFVGLTYAIDPRTSVNASYHYTNSSTSFDDPGNSEFQRNRFQLGVNRVF